MTSAILFPLIPAPLTVKTDTLSGELHIEGNLERNTIRFRFRFADSLEVSPLLIVIDAGSKTYRYYCIIRDVNTPVIETPVFHPEFNVGQQFMVTAVEPLARFLQSNEPGSDFEKT
jgi:hypothetical protein